MSDDVEWVVESIRAAERERIAAHLQAEIATIDEYLRGRVGTVTPDHIFGKRAALVDTLTWLGSEEQRMSAPEQKPIVPSPAGTTNQAPAAQVAAADQSPRLHLATYAQLEAELARRGRESIAPNTFGAAAVQEEPDRPAAFPSGTRPDGIYRTPDPAALGEEPTP